MEEPVAQRGAEKGLNEAARQRARIKSELGQTVRIGQGETVDPFHCHHLAGGAIHRPRARECPGHPGVFDEFRRRRSFQPEIHLHAHRARERLDDLGEPQATDSGARPSANRAAKAMSERSRAKRRSVPARSTFTATGRKPSSVFTSARWTWRLKRPPPARRTFEYRFDLRAKEASMIATAASPTHGRDAVLQPLKLQGDLAADDVGPRRKELSELDIGRPQSIDRPGEASNRRRRASQSSWRTRAAASAPEAGTGSTPTNAPSRANTNEARVSLKTWPSDDRIAINQASSPSGSRRSPRSGG